VLYVSPLKALSNDIRLNLLAPLEGISRELAAMGLPDHGIRSAVRTGDTTQRRTQRHAPARAAHPGVDAGIAVRAAGFGQRTRHAGTACAR
jgi:hypothetical protein